MDTEGRPHRLLSKEELTALTEGLRPPAPAVLAISPFVNDQQVLARALRERGFRVIAAARASWPEDAAGRACAAVIAGEVLQEDPEAVARLRAARRDLPVYVIWEDLAAAPPDVPPPAGIWARSLLKECVTMLATAEETTSPGPEGNLADAASAEHVPIDTEACAPLESATVGATYARLLETLLAPAHDPQTFLRRALRVLRAHLNVSAAAVLLDHGGFLLEVEAESAGLRRQAGRFLMESGREVVFRRKAMRLRPNAFAAVDCLPLLHGGNALGAVFLFLTRDAPVADASRICGLVASRLWELLCRSSPCGDFLPFEDFLARAHTHAGVLLLGAPLGEDQLERMLAAGEFWTREPAGAVLCCLTRSADAVAGMCGEDFVGFTTDPVRHPDLGAWVRSHGEVLAALRQAGRRGILPA